MTGIKNIEPFKKAISPLIIILLLVINHSLLASTSSANGDVTGWQHEEFEDNVEISYVPAVPKSNQKVNVKITSKVSNVTIAGANLWIEYRLRGQGEQVGGFVFERVNLTTLVSEIPGYPVGTEVTFWIDAWDKDIVKITSNEYTYTVTTYGYEAYGIEEFPQPAVYGAYVASLLVSAFTIFYFLRNLKRKELQSSKNRGELGIESRGK